MKQLLISFSLILGLSFAAFAQKSQVPAFSFTDLEGQAFTQASLNSEMPTAFLFFDPWCDHCAQQADWIHKSEDLLNDIQWVFVTTEPEFQASMDFKKAHFEGSGLKHLHFVVDTEFMFDGYFDGYYEVPSILTYNAQGQRTKVFSHETEIDELVKYLNK